MRVAYPYEATSMFARKHNREYVVADAEMAMHDAGYGKETSERFDDVGDSGSGITPRRLFHRSSYRSCWREQED